jgi:hypothetical protein
VAIYNWVTYHNLRPYKWTIIMYGGNQYFKKKRNFNQKFTIVGVSYFDELIKKWHYHGCYKLVASKLHNNYSYIVITKLHELHMYMVSHMMTYIHCNWCNLFDSTHTYNNMSSCKWMANSHCNSKIQLQG